MKIYIASRFDKKDAIQNLQKVLSDNGHTISADWTRHKRIKPYEENRDLAKEFSMEYMEGVKNSDIFILITDDAGKGMYTELGAAIMLNTLFGKPEIYVIGEHISNTIFFFHPAVKRLGSVQEIVAELSKK
jgi:hypothetical protein